MIVQVIVGFVRIVSERGLTFGRLVWEAGAGQLLAGSGTVTVEVHGTAGPGSPAEEAGIMTMPRAEDWRSRGGYFSWRTGGGGCRAS